MKICVTIKGVTPLLMDKFSETQLSSTKKKNKEMTPAEAAEQAVYRNADGELFIPGQNMFRCIIEGGRFSKEGKSKVTTLKNSLVCGGAKLLNEECKLGIKDYLIFKTSVVNQAIKARVMTYRPMIKDWRLTFTLDVDEEVFSSNKIKEIITHAGKRIGLGSWRPDTKGTYGKFEIEKFNVF